MTDTDEQQVRAVLAELVAAWGRQDADAYGALFLEDATYTTFVGSLYRGRSAIVESHRALFRTFLKGTSLTDDRIEVHFPGPDVAVVTSRGDVVKGRRRRPPGKAQTYTLVRDGNRWWIAAFHNTKRRPLFESISARLQPATAPSRV
ncbi:SgcJ/EcaC family oxidoreductase [Pseudonocardia ailaonensis]|uniref:SgcJ/EcaC family oxidoreductase n=1 Tax=Pseudonocardia ailaonensis TaxID=367279 RepID=A0ABN2MUQ2_9PSEU